MPEPTTYRIRPGIAALSCAPVPVVGAAVILVVLRPWPAGLVVAVVFVLFAFVPAFRRVRRRTLVVGESGLEVQRDQYRLLVGWDQVTGVQRRTHQWVLGVEELVLSGADLLPVDSRGRSSKVVPGLEGAPALRRVMVSIYDRDWRSGPIGRHLPASP